MKTSFPPAGAWCVYLLRRMDAELIKLAGQGSRAYYVGSTNNLHRRIRDHNDGACTATRGCAWDVRAVAVFATEHLARWMERQLKTGDTRAKRERFARLADVHSDPRAVGRMLFVPYQAAYEKRFALRALPVAANCPPDRELTEVS